MLGYQENLQLSALKITWVSQEFRTLLYEIILLVLFGVCQCVEMVENYFKTPELKRVINHVSIFVAFCICKLIPRNKMIKDMCQKQE